MEKFYIAVLNSISRIGSKITKSLVEFFGSAENVLLADLPKLQQAGVSQKVIDNLIEFRTKFPDVVKKLVEFCNDRKIKICTWYDKDYPPLLKEISDAPVVFYYRGTLNTNAERLGIVGARETTTYGETVAKTLSGDLAAAGITIVSGAARGIDTFAHSAAMRRGRTVAVLGYGINKIPPDQRKFLDEIVASGGVVMSEFPLNFEGNARTFPARNRIIAGLSRGVIVVETAEKSGTLITADFAKRFSRKIFVVPHNIFSEKGVGCNSLISQGATLITGSDDVLKYFNNKHSS